MKTWVLLLAFGLLQTPSIAPQPAIVQGRVVDAITLQPLARATVQLQGGRNLPRSTQYLLARDTAADGTFTFQNVPPGDYAIEVSHSGYIPKFYGAMRDASTPAMQTLNPGQSLAGVEVALTPGAVISGRVLDDRGEVVVRATVQALRSTYREGRRMRIVVQSVTSDDLGEYRLFLLAPGEYLVSVSEGAFATRPTIPWFFPGTVDSDAAKAIQLRAGETLADVTLTSVPTRGRKVSGRVQGASGNGASVSLSSRSGDVQMETTVDPDTGAFAFNGISPGAYTLVAYTVELKAAMTLDVQNTDILNANMTLAPGFRIPVRVRIDGHGDGPDPDLEKLYFAVQREPPVSGLGADVYSPFADGKLSLEFLAGDYRLDFARPQNNEDVYMMSIRHGDIDVLRQGLRVSNSSDTPIEILVGTNPGSVSGRTSGKNTTVVLVPDAARRGQRSLYKWATALASGEFVFQKVPPGEYKAFAWQEENGGPWLDPEYLRKYEEQGTAIRVEAGKVTVIDGVVPGL